MGNWTGAQRRKSSKKKMLLTDKFRARKILLQALAREMSAFNFAPEDLMGDFNIIDNGLVDSFGFIELMSRIEEDGEIELDFESTDPEEITTVDGLLAVIGNALDEEFVP